MAASDIAIRPVGADERAAWEPLWKGYLDFYKASVPRETYDVTWTRLQDPKEPMFLLGAYAGGRLAGIVHFSWYFRYMEEAEHALWRSLGIQIAPPGEHIGYPRVSASCDFKASLRFEEEVDVHVRVEAVGRRSLRYGFTLKKGDEIIATGAMTSVCVAKVPGEPLRSMDLPAEVVARLG